MGRPAPPEPPPQPPPLLPTLAAAAAHPPLQVVLRSINSSLSAYLSVTYNANFFDSYDVLDCTVVQAGLLMKVGGQGRGLGAGRRQGVCG